MIVVDANVLVYFTAATGRLRQLARIARARDAAWIAPPLWRSEHRNALFGYLRRAELAVDEAIDAQISAELVVSTRWVGTDEIIAAGNRSSASAYDCEYVALARRLGVPLVTADRKLAESFPDTCVVLDQFAS
jgi:predicted nucleic acid-binding protein